MPGASEDLLQAVYGLRKAAEAEFQGNTYYQAANQIDGLIEQLGWDSGVHAGNEAAYGFATMLAALRKLARAELFANDYYRIAHRLELLGSFVTPSGDLTPDRAKSEARAAPAPSDAPANPPLHIFGTRRSFDDLAALSKGRAGGIIRGLGIGPAHHIEVAHQAEAVHREPDLISAGGELERRSSEPCSMAELAPVIVETVAAAAVSAEASAMPRANGAARDLGSSSAEAGDGAIKGTAAATAEEAPAPAGPELSASEHGRAPHAAGQAVESPPAERRLESRSSEAIAQAVEAMEPASLPGEIASGAGVQQAPLHLGSPSLESEAKEAAGFREIAAKETAAEAPAAPVSAPSAPAPEKIGAKKADEPKRERPKTRFRLWLDLAFGRKR